MENRNWGTAISKVIKIDGRPKSAAEWIWQWNQSKRMLVPGRSGPVEVTPAYVVGAGPDAEGREFSGFVRWFDQGRPSAPNRDFHVLFCEAGEAVEPALLPIMCVPNLCPEQPWWVLPVKG